MEDDDVYCLCQCCVHDLPIKSRFASFVKQCKEKIFPIKEKSSDMVLEKINILETALSKRISELDRNICYLMSVIAKFTKFPEEQPNHAENDQNQEK